MILTESRSELAVHVGVGDDGNGPSRERQREFPADEFPVALVVGMGRDRGVAQQGLRARRRDFDIAFGGAGSRPLHEGIADVVHGAALVLVLHLVVGEGGAAGRAPFDEILAPVDETALVERDENLAHGPGQAFVEREPLAAPVAGGADLFELLRDDCVMLGLHLPGLFDELLAAQVAAVHACGAQSLLHDMLRGDAGVVGARHPQCRLPAHAVIPHQDILERVV